MAMGVARLAKGGGAQGVGAVVGEGGRGTGNAGGALVGRTAVAQGGAVSTMGEACSGTPVLRPALPSVPWLPTR